MFIENDTTSAYSSDSLQSSRQLIDQLIQSTEHLREFVHLRTRAYLLLVRHQEALMRAVLPKTDDVPYWLVTHYVDQSKTIDDLMPAEIPVDPLSLALSLATEAFEDWDHAIETALPSLEQALLLNDLLQSPAIAQFLQADQRRLELYHSWRPRIAKTFKTLCKATSSAS